MRQVSFVVCLVVCFLNWFDDMENKLALIDEEADKKEEAAWNLCPSNLFQSIHRETTYGFEPYTHH